MSAPTGGPEPGTTRSTARNAAASASANVLGKIATLIWTVLAARTLGSGDFGAFFYALSFALLLSAAVEWGYDSIMAELASRDLPRLPALFSRAVAWEVLVGVPLFTIGGLVAGAFRPSDSSRVVLALVLAAVLLDVLAGSVRAAAAAAQDQGGTSKALVVQRVTTLVLITGALLAGAGVVGLSAAFLLGSMIGLVVALAAVRPLGVRFDRRAVRRGPMREFFASSVVLGLTTLTLMSLFRVDGVLLGALTDDREVGAYAAAYRLLETVLFVVFALRSAIFPVMTADGSAPVIRKSVESALTTIGVLYLPFSAVCLAESESILTLLYGQAYADVSADTLRLLAVAPMAYGVAYLANGALQALGRHRAMLACAAGGTVLNVALNVALIPRYGGGAAAFSTTVSYALVAAALLLLLRSSGVRIALLRPLREAGVAAVVLGLLLVVSPLPTLLEMPLCLVAYVLVWAGLVRRTSPEQLQLLRRALSVRR